MGDGVDDCQDVLGGGLFAAGQGDDQAAVSDARHAAAQAALGGDPHGFRPHSFGDAGSGTFNDIHGSLGGNVSGGEASAAGGENQRDI